MSDKTFKVGDRVRVGSDDHELKAFHGLTGVVRSIRDTGHTLLIRLDGERFNRTFYAPSLEHEHQPRLPQVGEVWRSRDGKFTTAKIEKKGALPYCLAAFCSDGQFRRWTLLGRWYSDQNESPGDLVELVEEAPQSVNVQAPEPQVEEAPQKRLPQVGEVWRSRDGKFTVKIEANTSPGSQEDGYILCGLCSDKEFRTFAADGRFCVHVAGSVKRGSDLVELVSESQPEPQLKPTLELEVSVDVVPLVNIKDKETVLEIYHNKDEDVLVNLAEASDWVNIGSPTLDEIAALARCFAKLHEILSKEAAK